MVIGASGSYVVVGENNVFRVGFKKETTIYINNRYQISGRMAKLLLEGVGMTILGNKNAMVIDIEGENCWIVQRFDNLWFLYMGEEGTPDYNLG